MTSAFYNRAQGVVVTFDVGQRESFAALASWIRDVRRDAPQGCVIVLCANKTDLDADLWKVRREEYTAFAREGSFELFEASSKSGHNVQDMFVQMARKILQQSRGELAELSIDRGDSSAARGESIVLFDLNPDERKKMKRKRCGGCVIQ